MPNASNTSARAQRLRTMAQALDKTPARRVLHSIFSICPHCGGEQDEPDGTCTRCGRNGECSAIDEEDCPCDATESAIGTTPR